LDIIKTKSNKIKYKGENMKTKKQIEKETFSTIRIKKSDIDFLKKRYNGMKIHAIISILTEMAQEPNKKHEVKNAKTKTNKNK
jgi:hypothetical protein